MRYAIAAFAFCAAVFAVVRPGVADQITVNGGSRTYLIKQPSTVSGPQPTVIILLAAKGTGATIAQSTELDTLAPQQGFVAVFPDGLRQQWNFFLPGKEADFFVKQSGGRDKVSDDGAFLKSLIADLVRRRIADSHRIYLFGEDSGGLLALRTVCTDADLFAGIALSGSAMPDALADCHPSHPIPALIIKGTKDEILPYAGGLSEPSETYRVWSTERLVGFFQQLDNDTGPAQSSVLPRKVPNIVQIDQWTDCAGVPLAVYRVIDGPHRTPPDLNEGQVVLDFFASPSLQRPCVASLQNPASGAGTPGTSPNGNSNGQDTNPNGTPGNGSSVPNAPSNGTGTNTAGPDTPNGPNSTAPGTTPGDNNPAGPGSPPDTNNPGNTAGLGPPPDNDPGNSTAGLGPPPDNDPGNSTAGLGPPPDNDPGNSTAGLGPPPDNDPGNSTAGLGPPPDNDPGTSTAGLGPPTDAPPAHPGSPPGPGPTAMIPPPYAPLPPVVIPIVPPGPATPPAGSQPHPPSGNPPATTNTGTSPGTKTAVLPPVTLPPPSSPPTSGSTYGGTCKTVGGVTTCTGSDGRSCTTKTGFCDPGTSQVKTPSLPTGTASTTPSAPAPPATTARTLEPVQPKSKKQAQQKPPRRYYNPNVDAANAAAAAATVIGIVGAFGRHGGGFRGGGGHPSGGYIHHH